MAEVNHGDEILAELKKGFRVKVEDGKIEAILFGDAFLSAQARN